MSREEDIRFIEEEFSGEEKDTVCFICGKPANSETDFCPRCGKIVCFECILDGHYDYCIDKEGWKE